jgi:hypothetical protein
MTLAFRLRWLRVALLVSGVLCLGVWPLMVVWPSGWSWHPHGSHSEYMIIVVYAVLGVFLLRAMRDPLRHRSLIWFTVWSSLAHGGLMAWQSLTDSSEHGHMLGDVPALLVGALVLGVLMPRGAEADKLAEGHQAA